MAHERGCWRMQYLVTESCALPSRPMRMSEERGAAEITASARRFRCRRM